MGADCPTPLTLKLGRGEKYREGKKGGKERKRKMEGEKEKGQKKRERRKGERKGNKQGSSRTMSLACFYDHILLQSL